MIAGFFLLMALFVATQVNSVATRNEHQNVLIQETIKARLTRHLQSKALCSYTFSPRQDALQVIQQKLNEEKKTPQSVKLTYDLAADQLIRTSTKIRYNEYRKKPRVQNVVYAKNTRSDATLTFLYTPASHSLVTISKQGAAKSRTVEHLSLQPDITYSA